MKLFYVCTPETARFIPTGWHGQDLGNGRLMVCIDWKNEAHELAWSSRIDVMSLPHPIFESSQPLSAEHHKHLGGRYKLNAGDNVHHVIKQAAKEDLWMRLWVL